MSHIIRNVAPGPRIMSLTINGARRSVVLQPGQQERVDTIDDALKRRITKGTVELVAEPLGAVAPASVPAPAPQPAQTVTQPDAPAPQPAQTVTQPDTRAPWQQKFDAALADAAGDDANGLSDWRTLHHARLVKFAKLLTGDDQIANKQQALGAVEGWLLIAAADA